MHWLRGVSLTAAYPLQMTPQKESTELCRVALRGFSSGTRSAHKKRHEPQRLELAGLMTKAFLWCGLFAAVAVSTFEVIRQFVTTSLQIDQQIEDLFLGQNVEQAVRHRRRC